MIGESVLVHSIIVVEYDLVRAIHLYCTIISYCMIHTYIYSIIVLPYDSRVTLVYRDIIPRVLYWYCTV